MAEVFGYKREQASDSDFDVKQLLQAAPVKLAVGDKVKLATVSALDRDDPGEGGAIYPGKVLERLRDLV